jgi:hypothetical protein
MLYTYLNNDYCSESFITKAIAGIAITNIYTPKTSYTIQLIQKWGFQPPRKKKKNDGHDVLRVELHSIASPKSLC